jgi:hypothetical protein
MCFSFAAAVGFSKHIVIKFSINKTYTRYTYFESDLEDKLQTYNKINGAIRRHFGETNDPRNKIKDTHDG